VTKGGPPRVILLGGAPATGKSTIARALADQLGHLVIATDDLGAAVRGVTEPAVAPELFAAHPGDHREYLASHSGDELLEHALRSHRALWPAIESVIHAHATWSTPAIVEGWTLLPDLVAGFDHVAAVWIEIPGSVLEERVRADTAFYAGASDPDLVIRRFIRRSVEFGGWLRTEISARELPHVRLSGAETPVEASHALLEALQGQ
jgi:2-phosphoglycerate kinase